MNKYKITIYLNNDTQDTYIIEAQDFNDALLIEGTIELNYNQYRIKDIDLTRI